jgi:uncharacterized protein (DUF427 family)
MGYIMRLDDVLNEWEIDSQIDKSDLTEASRETPKLHAKYLKVLSQTKLRLKQSEMDQKSLLKNKWLYYNGKMTKEQMDELGWSYEDHLNGLKVLKGDMDYYYDSDKEIQESELKIQYYKNMVETLQEIVDNLKWRHQTIKNMIEWKKFETGY